MRLTRSEGGPGEKLKTKCKEQVVVEVNKTIASTLHYTTLHYPILAVQWEPCLMSTTHSAGTRQLQYSYICLKTSMEASRMSPVEPQHDDSSALASAQPLIIVCLLQTRTVYASTVWYVLCSTQ